SDCDRRAGPPLHRVVSSRELLRSFRTGPPAESRHECRDTTAIALVHLAVRLDERRLLDSVDSSMRMARRTHAVITPAKRRRPGDITGAAQNAMRKPSIRGCRTTR